MDMKHISLIKINDDQYIVKSKVVSFGIDQENKKKMFVWLDGGNSIIINTEAEADAKWLLEEFTKIFNGEK